MTVQILLQVGMTFKEVRWCIKFMEKMVVASVPKR